MPTEERVLRAREVLARAGLDMDDPAQAEWAEWLLAKPRRLDREEFKGSDIIPAMLTFSDEGSGIGERRMLLDLLAIIHGDGGQHVDSVGLQQAVDDAITLSAEWKAGIGELRERHPSRFHFTDDAPMPVETIEGTILLGKGWLAITEEEYRELNASPDIDRSGIAQEVE